MFTKFQPWGFAGEETEVQPVLSVSLKATEPGWARRRSQTKPSCLTSNLTSQRLFGSSLKHSKQVFRLSILFIPLRKEQFTYIRTPKGPDDV